MRNLVPLLTARGTDANAEEADLLRDEVQRLYRVASDLRSAKKRVRTLSLDEDRAKGERLAWWSKGYNAAITDALRALEETP